MKKKWLAGVCVATCVASLLTPGSMTMWGRQTTGSIAYAETSTTQYDGTYSVPVTSAVSKNDSVASVQQVSFEGKISESNTEDIYLLNVQDSAISLEFQGIVPDNVFLEMELQTLPGNTLKSCTLSDSSNMIDTTTGTRQEGIYRYYLAKGQYLCKISKYYGNGEGTYKVNAYSVDAAETKSISIGKKYVSYARHGAQYKKITVKEAGKLTIKSNMYGSLTEIYDTQLVNNEGDYFTLCNSKKKELTGQATGQTSKCYGVKKGTYYIKLSNAYSEYRVYSASFKKAGAPTNTKKKKAKTITAKKKSYVLTSGSNAVQWYKFTLKKAKKMKLYVDNATDGKLRIEIYEKKEGSPSCVYVDASCSTDIQHVQNNKVIKWDKGTYYIKICKYYANNTGGIVSVKLK